MQVPRRYYSFVSVQQNSCGHSAAESSVGTQLRTYRKCFLGKKEGADHVQLC